MQAAHPARPCRAGTCRRRPAGLDELAATTNVSLTAATLTAAPDLLSEDQREQNLGASGKSPWYNYRTKEWNGAMAGRLRAEGPREA